MRRRWIRAVRGIGNQHGPPLRGRVRAIARVNIGANDHHARHLAVRAGGGLQ